MALFIDFFGRFHPLLLHLPIGILVYAYLQWIYDRWKKKNDPTDLTFALVLGSISAVLSAWSGWILAQNGGYDQELLEWHKYLGIGTAIGSFLLLGFYYFKARNVILGGLFTVFILILGATGHYGGSLTHGKDFLTKQKKKTTIREVLDIQEAHIFDDVVMPIFERKCVSCHSPEKSKGDLLLHNLEGWKKGGKHGEILKAGFPTESHILQRIALPKEEDEHMPPDGKLQLTLNEITFLEWWIKEMISYDHRVKDLKPTGKVAQYLKSLEGDEFEGIEKPSLSDLDKLYNYGIVARLVSATTPWVEISFLDKSNVKSSLSKLKKVANNIIHIDLSHSNITDGDLKNVKRFKNLRKLNLNNTSISNKGVKHLLNLDELSYINLYKTNVDNDIFKAISQLKNLQNIYLWQTKVDRTFARNWASDNPHIQVDLGIDESLFGIPKLATPVIGNEVKLFKDSIEVSFSTSNPRATIVYSLKTGTNKIESVYEAPFSINQSYEISAFLTQDGWTNSDTITRKYIKTKYKPTNITLSIPPHEKYPGNGPETLGDFKKGSESFSDGKWLGFYGRDVNVILDLGEAQSIEKVNIGTLLDTKSYIFSPLAIRVETSNNDEDYRLFGADEYPTPKGNSNAQINEYTILGNAPNSRYVRISITAQKKNPKWHPAPGADSWLFLDEIIVE